MKVTPVPKFNYNQRVYDRRLGFGWLIIKGLRFATVPGNKPAKPNSQEYNEKIIYTLKDGSKPQWEYNCYKIIKDDRFLNYFDHEEIGWFKESDLHLDDEY